MKKTNKKQIDTKKIIGIAVAGAAFLATAGYVTALLTAPKSGKETREDIAKGYDAVKTKTKTVAAKAEDVARKDIAAIKAEIEELSQRLAKIGK